MLSAVKVLLIDDDPDAAHLLSGELERHAIEVVWARDYRSGVESFEAGGFDAVLVDHFLGVRTGLEFLHHATATRPEVPVILVTAVDSAEIDEAALEAGAAGFVLKEEARGALLDRTIRYAVRRGNRHGVASSTPRSRAAGKDLTLQVALSRGMTIRDAARASGMSERTAYRRMNDPEFQAQLAALESELRNRMVDRAVEDILSGD